MYRMGGERVRWPAVVDRARQIVESCEGGVTLRQVMYRLVSAEVLPHTPSRYRRLSSRLAQARREGPFPGPGRHPARGPRPAGRPDAGAFLREAVDWFALDRTRGQKHALYVAAEKDPLRQLLTGWLAEYGIPVLVIRGARTHTSCIPMSPRPPVPRLRRRPDSAAPRSPSEGASGKTSRPGPAYSTGPVLRRSGERRP